MPNPVPCPEACRCDVGNPLDGGRLLNNKGYCEHYCSIPFRNDINQIGQPTFGTRHCGDGKEYQKGDFIDCSGCNGNFLCSDDMFLIQLFFCKLKQVMYINIIIIFYF